MTTATANLVGGILDVKVAPGRSNTLADVYATPSSRGLSVRIHRQFDGVATSLAKLASGSMDVTNARRRLRI